MKTTCRDCGKSWGGYRAEHCTVCHETLSGSSAGETHRRGEFPDGRYCTTEGLNYDESKGVWRLPAGDHVFG